MHAPLHPRSHPPARSVGRRRRRHLRPGQRLAQHTPVLEVGARLGVNGLLAIAALGALAQLVPYIQTQAQRLEQISQAVESAEASNAKLKTDFGRYFDPAQAGRLIQEYSGYKMPQERQIVWTDPTRP
jgi:hypothetical protein